MLMTILARVCRPYRQVEYPVGASSWLSGRVHVASRYLVLVRCESAEDFSLLARRHFEEVKGARKLCRDGVEFFRRDLEITMRLFKTHLSFPWLCGCVVERPARDCTDPQSSHELEAWQPAQVLSVPLP